MAKLKDILFELVDGCRIKAKADFDTQGSLMTFVYNWSLVLNGSQGDKVIDLDYRTSANSVLSPNLADGVYTLTSTVSSINTDENGNVIYSESKDCRFLMTCAVDDCICLYTKQLAGKGNNESACKCGESGGNRDDLLLAIVELQMTLEAAKQCMRDEDYLKAAYMMEVACALCTDFSAELSAAENAGGCC